MRLMVGMRSRRIAYGLAAIAYGLLFCIAVAIAGVSNR